MDPLLQACWHGRFFIGVERNILWPGCGVTNSGVWGLPIWWRFPTFGIKNGSIQCNLLPQRASVAAVLTSSKTGLNPGISLVLTLGCDKGVIRHFCTTLQGWASKQTCSCLPKSSPELEDQMVCPPRLELHPMSSNSTSSWVLSDYLAPGTEYGRFERPSFLFAPLLKFFPPK